MFDLLPNDAGHFIPVHFHNWIFDLNFCHEKRPTFCDHNQEGRILPLELETPASL